MLPKKSASFCDVRTNSQTQIFRSDVSVSWALRKTQNISRREGSTPLLAADELQENEEVDCWREKKAE